MLASHTIISNLLAAPMLSGSFDSAAIFLYIALLVPLLCLVYDRRSTKNKLNEMERALEFSADVYNAMAEAVVVMNAGNIILSVNPAFSRLTGFTEADVVGRSVDMIKVEKSFSTDCLNIFDSSQTTGQWQGEVMIRSINNMRLSSWLVLGNIYNQEGKLKRRVGIFSKVTDRKIAEQTIWRQANFDILTDLPNRRMFMDRLHQDIKKSNRTGMQTALIFLDLDQFKEVNDTLGHQVGDMLLKAVAKRLLDCVRSSDTVARLGGDEFTVILSEMESLSNVEYIAQKILQELAKPYSIGKEVIYLSASIGITIYPNDGQAVEELVMHADQAMYVSKREGRNRYSYFTPALQKASQRKMGLSTDLRSAIALGQFKIVYQPVINAGSGHISKAEALLRWDHPDLGPISPVEFIPIAEDTGSIIEIGNWMFEQAARQCALWRNTHQEDIKISVNMSPVQFTQDASMHSAWFHLLDHLGLPRHSIVLEITEGVLLHAEKIVEDKLLKFRDAGIQVAIDDFGTGYSSLSYLKKFDIDYLKIDQSFISNMKLGSDDMALCEAIIEMAHKLGLSVIAEGVETDEQRSLLQDAGCDFGQGYFFSRPLTALQFEALMEQPSNTSWISSNDSYYAVKNNKSNDRGQRTVARMHG